MADLLIVASDVHAGAQSDGAVVRNVVAGEAVSPGDAIYKKQSDAEWYKADANLSAEAAGQYGIAVALTYAGDGEPLVIQAEGEYTVGVAVVVGQVYVVSGNPGKIAPVTDGVAGWFTTILGVATTTTKIKLKPNVSGVARA